MIFGNTIPMAGKALDYLWKKQEVTSDNIANVDTPGYKTKSVSFEETFQNKLKAASGTHDNTQMRQAIDSSTYQIYDTSSSARVDENNVNLDVEYTELTRTALHYQYLLQSVNNDFTRYRSAIKGQ
ncbi:flagellar basal body rod protein FlgB [Luxibacter massiliensis]|uniref:flagellar basal body rod protein FlgB n=1 Tax=Luxibacter massiliensis TaxID=2219695 RepID=UPI000F051854|nr:flagellar basal body rod protein FlgB [Luxibacter massiliensis]